MRKIKLTRNSLYNLLILCLYPTLCILFFILNVGKFWGLSGSLIALIGFSIGYDFFIDSVRDHPTLLSDVGQFFMYMILYAIYFSSAFLVLISGDLGPFASVVKDNATLSLILVILFSIITSSLLTKRLEKFGLTNKRVESDLEFRSFIWIIFALSAAILTSIGFSGIITPVGIIDLLFVVPYSVIFGWFGPEIFRYKGKSLVFMGFYLLYWMLSGVLLEKANINFGSPKINGEVLFTSGIMWFTLFCSRCLKDIDLIRQSRITRAHYTIRRANLISLMETEETSFIIQKHNRLDSPITYRLLFLKDQLLFFRVSSPTNIEKRPAPTRRIMVINEVEKAWQTLDSEPIESRIESMLKKPEDLNEVNPEELRNFDEKNFELPYDDITEIEIKEATTKVERAFKAGVIIIKRTNNQKSERFSIYPNQDFAKCKKILQDALSNMMVKHPQ